MTARALIDLINREAEKSERGLDSPIVVDFGGEHMRNLSVYWDPFMPSTEEFDHDGSNSIVISTGT